MSVSNLHPENLSLRELSHYGLDHEDLWIRRLSWVVFELLTNSEHQEFDEGELAQFFDDFRNKVSDLEYDVKDAQTHAENMEDLLEEAKTTISSLRYDLSNSHQAREVTQLKAHIYEKSLKFDEVQRDFQALQRKFEKLAENYSDLQTKMQTWTILAT